MLMIASGSASLAISARIPPQIQNPQGRLVAGYEQTFQARYFFAGGWAALSFLSLSIC